jgi:hypothetical protein
MHPHDLTCPRGKGRGAKEELCFAHGILDFHFFSSFVFACGPTVPSSILPLWFECEVLLQVPWS